MSFNEIEHEWLKRIADIRVNQTGGKRRPHKPLLLLVAIKRLTRDGICEIPYAEVEEPLVDLLDAYAPPVRNSHHPEYPWWHLRTDGLWEVRDAERMKLQANGMPTMWEFRASVGRLPERFALVLTRNPTLVERSIRALLDGHFEPSLHDDIRSAIGLDTDRLFVDDAVNAVADEIASVRDSIAVNRRMRERSFRNEVLAAYDYRCSATGFQTLMKGVVFCLEAAHVHWHSQGGEESVDNGLALTPTLHRLFDHGAWSLTDDRRILISSRLSGSDATITELRSLHLRPIRSPRLPADSVAISNIRWHREEDKGGVFRMPALTAP
jgi:putative restriction endonuclease